MKRPCFALSMLLASLAGSLAAVSTANSQSGYEPEPGSWHADACPLAPGASDDAGLCEDEDARWLKHQAEEKYDDLYNYDKGSAGESPQEPTPAKRPENFVEVAEPTETRPAPAAESVPDYGYRSGYDGEYDYEVYRSETEKPTEPAPATETKEELDPYWNENKLPSIVTGKEDAYWDEKYNEATEELDPYWTQGKVPADVTEELDPYWTEGKVPADVTEELDPYWTNNRGATSDSIENATIDPQWARDAVETVESWLDKLNSRPESEGTATESLETPKSTPVPAEESNFDHPAENADPIYGPHIWDDCDLGHKLRNCDRPAPEITNYAEPAPARNESFNVIEHRDLLHSVARILNEAGEALQTASRSLNRIADEGTASEPWQYDPYQEEYRD